MAGVCEGEYMGRCPGDEPLTLTRCYSCEIPQPYEVLECEIRLWPSPHLRAERENFFFHIF